MCQVSKVYLWMHLWMQYPRKWWHGGVTLLVTAGIRRMREGNIFSLCVSFAPRGGYPHPLLMGSTPILPDGVPNPRSGRGYPHPRSGWGVPHTPILTRDGGTLHPGQVPGQDGGTPNWNSIACTWYATSGMSLAFTQEDFLVEYLSDYIFPAIFNLFLNFFSINIHILYKVGIP